MLHCSVFPYSSGLVPSEYVDLEEKLRLSSLYEPVLVNEFAPQDRIQRRSWLAKLSLPYRICLYWYAYCNNLGTLTYAWKIPEGPLDQTAISRVFSQFTSLQQTYSSRGDGSCLKLGGHTECTTNIPTN